MDLHRLTIRKIKEEFPRTSPLELGFLTLDFVREIYRLVDGPRHIITAHVV